MAAPKTIVIEGTGDWVRTSYRPAILSLASSAGLQDELTVWYIDRSDPPREPEWRSLEWGAQELHSGREGKLAEVYLPGNSDTWRGIPMADAVCVVTPDFTHMDVAEKYLEDHGPAARAASILVEKPFAHDMDAARRFRRQLESLGTGRPEVRAIDHYAFQISALRNLLDGKPIQDLIGEICRFEFYMLEETETESHRISSLQGGLTRDLGSHFLAILSHFCDLSSMSDIQIHCAGSHLRSGYSAETCSALSFVVQLRDSGQSVECTSVVGKGIGATVKFCDIHGEDNNVIRLEFTHGESVVDYPFRSAFHARWMDSEHDATGLRDPHRTVIATGDRPDDERSYTKAGTQSLEVLDVTGFLSNPYRDLFEALLIGRSTPFLLSHVDAEYVVDALDRWSGALSTFRRDYWRRYREKSGRRSQKYRWPPYATGAPFEAQLGNGRRIYRTA